MVMYIQWLGLLIAQKAYKLQVIAEYLNIITIVFRSLKVDSKYVVLQEPAIADQAMFGSLPYMRPACICNKQLNPGIK